MDSPSEAVWIWKMLEGLFDEEIDITDILYDNQSCIKMTKNPIFHDKLKHIEVRYHFIWYMVQKGVLKLKYVPIEEQVVDVLTKPRSHVKFEYFWENLGVVRKDLPQKREWRKMVEVCSGGSSA